MEQPSTTFIGSFRLIRDSFREDRLKLCYLWFQELIFEDAMPWSGRGYLTKLEGWDQLHSRDRGALQDALSPLSDRVPASVEARQKNMIRGYPRWVDDPSRYTYPEPETPEQFAHNALLEAFERERGVRRLDGIEIEYAEGRARAATDIVLLWQEVNSVVPCTLQCTSDERLAIDAMTRFTALPDTEPAKVLFQSTIPSLRHLPWSEVVRLRSTGLFDVLREKMRSLTLAAEGDLDEAKRKLAHAEAEAVEEIVNRARPKIGSSLFEGIAGNIPLPLPIPNPISIYSAIKTVIAQNRQDRDFGWLYMLRDLRATASLLPSST